jgi:hypothetical protein
VREENGSGGVQVVNWSGTVEADSGAWYDAGEGDVGDTRGAGGE